MTPSDRNTCPDGDIASPANSTRVVRYLGFRYSVGAMLALVTGICIWLAIQTNAARQQRKAVDAIVALGGQVRYDFEGGGIFELMVSPGLKPKERPGPSWLRTLIGDDYFQTVTGVDLRGREVTDSDLRWISSLPNLNILLVMRTKISDVSMSRIGKLSQLKILVLRDNDITDQGLAQLHRLRHLEQLNVINTRVTPEGVTRLKREVGPILIHVEERKPETLKYQALRKPGIQSPKKRAAGSATSLFEQ